MTETLYVRVTPGLMTAIQEMAGLLNINYREYVRTRLAQIVQQERAHYERNFAPRPEPERTCPYCGNLMRQERTPDGSPIWRCDSCHALGLVRERTIREVEEAR